MQSRKNRGRIGARILYRASFGGCNPSPNTARARLSFILFVVITMQQSYDSATKSAETTRSPDLDGAISLDVSWATRDVSWVTRETSRGCAVLGIHDRSGGRFSASHGGDSRRGMFGGYAGLRLRRQRLRRGRRHPIGRRANSMACVTGSRPNPYIDRFDAFLRRKRALVSCS